MLTQKEVWEMMRETGAIVEGHFLLNDGTHSGKHIQTAKVLQYPNYANAICGALAWKLRHINADLVVGILSGSVICAHEVARHLGVRAVFVERVDGKMVLRRSFNIKKGENVLIVEDLVNTGKSVRETMDLVKKLGGNVLGVGILADLRKIDFGIPTESLLDLDFKTYKPDECPYCKKGEPLEELGTSMQFIEPQLIEVD